MGDHTALSLFSGVGGLDHGLALAGFRHVLLCETDPWRRDVLRVRFPGVPVAEDVRDVAGLSGGVSLVAGGSPCQDLSVAGQRRGLDGDRSGLFYEMARVVGAIRPRWVLWENVPGAFSSNGGRDFGAVLGTLADLGYGLGWRVLDSRFFGVPQRRRRVFIVGALAGGDPRAAAERAGQVLAVGTRCPRHPATGGEAGTGAAATFDGGAVSTLQAAGGDRGYRVDAEAAAGGHLVAAPVAFHQTQDPIHGAGFSPALGVTSIGMGVSAGAAVRRLTPTECERLQALPDGWTRLDASTPDSRRYAALGDAVTASVGEWIGRRIIQADV